MVHTMMLLLLTRLIASISLFNPSTIEALEATINITSHSCGGAICYGQAFLCYSNGSSPCNVRCEDPSSCEGSVQLTDVVRLSAYEPNTFSGSLIQCLEGSHC
eukprot:105299_1